MIPVADSWELRWIAASFPEQFQAPGLASALNTPFITVDEHDVYVLTDSSRVNLKVRRRANALKLKILEERADDRLERWSTPIDAPLPAGAEVFRRVSMLLRDSVDVAGLGDEASADQLVNRLSEVVGPTRLIAMTKTRQLFERAEWRIDCVTWNVGDRGACSLGVESESAAVLRALARTLDVQALGVTCNYVEYLLGATSSG
jgi:hypothetical protein